MDSCRSNESKDIEWRGTEYWISRGNGRQSETAGWFAGSPILPYRSSGTFPAQTENFMKYHFTGTWRVLIRCEINLTLLHTYVDNENFQSIRKCNIIAKVFVCTLVDIFYERITCILWNISWNFISTLTTLDNHWSNFKKVWRCRWKL